MPVPNKDHTNVKLNYDRSCNIGNNVIIWYRILAKVSHAIEISSHDVTFMESGIGAGAAVCSLNAMRDYALWFKRKCERRTSNFERRTSK